MEGVHEYIPVSPATLEDGAGGSKVQGQLGQLSGTLSQNKNLKRARNIAQWWSSCLACVRPGVRPSMEKEWKRGRERKGEKGEREGEKGEREGKREREEEEGGEREGHGQR